MIQALTPRVKICGLTRTEDVNCAHHAGAAFLGFIVGAVSPRALSPQAAADLAAPMSGKTSCVAVTVNADDALLSAITAQMAPDYIQCHGDESPERVAHISRMFAVKTIKAVTILRSEDVIRAESYSGAADFILYDAKPPKGAAIRGGHGVAFDWTLLTDGPRPKLWALAGGLTPENAHAAFDLTKAPILDVSTGVEASPGIKDPAKINAFMDAVKGQ